MAMKLGEKLTRWLDRMGLSARELSRRLGVSPPTIGRWASGEREPRRPELVKLAREMGVTLDYLADDGQDNPPAPEVTPDERLLLDTLRRAGIAPAEALARLLGGPPRA